MEYKATGKITEFLPVQTGESTNGPWAKQSFCIEVENGQYTDLLAFEVWGQEKVDKLTEYQKVGDTVEVKFNIKSRRWDQKAFTNLTAWRIEILNSVDVTDSTTNPVNESAAAHPTQPQQFDDDLPF